MKEKARGGGKANIPLQLPRSPEGEWQRSMRVAWVGALTQIQRGASVSLMQTQYNCDE
jgi:hypothetical protein